VSDGGSLDRGAAILVVSKPADSRTCLTAGRPCVGGTRSTAALADWPNARGVRPRSSPGHGAGRRRAGARRGNHRGTVRALGSRTTVPARAAPHLRCSGGRRAACTNLVRGRADVLQRCPRAHRPGAGGRASVRSGWRDSPVAASRQPPKRRRTGRNRRRSAIAGIRLIDRQPRHSGVARSDRPDDTGFVVASERALTQPACRCRSTRSSRGLVKATAPGRQLRPSRATSTSRRATIPGEAVRSARRCPVKDRRGKACDRRRPIATTSAITRRNRR